LTARRFVIAAGSRAAVPEMVMGVRHWTNATLFDLTERPDHLLILGGGPIGLEMADAFAGLGVRVTVVQSRAIAPRDDPALVAPLRSALIAHGVAIEENARVVGAEPGPTLTLADGRRITGSHILVATGRVPNLEALDLDKAGVVTSAHGVVTDAGLRSLSNRRVFAVGDIADPQGLGPRQFTHVGSYHAGIVIRRALFRLPARIDYAALPRVTYTDPELAQVGLTLAEAGAGAEALDWPMAENDRAIAEGDTTGLARIVIKGGRVVGAGIVAPHAGEMIGTWTLAISQRVKLAALAGMIVPYPTRAEAGKRAIGGLFARKLFAERTRWLVRTLARLG
jgi:pyruvate/2-oxoglutarate dehydrogenase complex dihydrolipoamide dehydrogenase (E3) component